MNIENMFHEYSMRKIRYFTGKGIKQDVCNSAVAIHKVHIRLFFFASEKVS